MVSSRVLFIVTAADHLTLKDGSRHPTGYWADELVQPHRLLREAGASITLATPGGAKPVVDQGSLAPEATGGPAGKKALTDYLASMRGELEAPKALEDMRSDDYDVVVVPGGHGPMEDLVDDAAVGRILTEMLQAGKKVAIVCHAPAAMLAARTADGSWPFRGYRMTAFTNQEEVQGGLAPRLRWLLEDRLREAGALFEAADPWSVHVVVDRNLYTGQNPMSAGPMAERLIADLT
jgi:putative intracellular protease/amidase